jgi:hypothetical protein
MLGEIKPSRLSELFTVSSDRRRGECRLADMMSLRDLSSSDLLVSIGCIMERLKSSSFEWPLSMPFSNEPCRCVACGDLPEAAAAAASDVLSKEKALKLGIFSGD